MIPAITPPTDNLYKFLSLFGLTIFLFAIYNLGAVYDRSAESQMKIEDIKVDVQKAMYRHDKMIKLNIAVNANITQFKPAKIKMLDENLQKIKQTVINSDLRPIVKIELYGEISKQKVELDSMIFKLKACIGFTILGALIMIFGFWRWHKREQTLRDQMLEMEHEQKKREQQDGEKRSRRIIPRRIVEEN
ncbi:MAG: hypothetical protein K0R65_614 [Crocinitomicaceae bacterium]|jgi:hypothetical protein|nr:hypothetical protein [Crocinitomicaceae bacterium]